MCANIYTRFLAKSARCCAAGKWNERNEYMRRPVYVYKRSRYLFSSARYFRFQLKARMYRCHELHRNTSTIYWRRRRRRLERGIFISRAHTCNDIAPFMYTFFMCLYLYVYRGIYIVYGYLFAIDYPSCQNCAAATPLRSSGIFRESMQHSLER